MENEYIGQTCISLDKVIELFSQPLLSHQIANYAYEILTEMISSGAIALFLETQGGFSLTQQHSYPFSTWCVPYNSNLHHLPTYHAGIVTHNWERWFPLDWIEAFHPSVLIPLAMKQTLFGWIVCSERATKQWDKVQLEFAQSLLLLVQSALERNEQQQKITDLQSQFDKTIYSMMVLQTYTTSLLTQNSLQTLYRQAVDAFSELARSQVTTLAVWDDLRQCLMVVAFQDQLSGRKQYKEFILHDGDYGRLIDKLYEFGKDDEQLNRIFTSIDDFSDLSAKYMILLGKEQILGFVTLSDSSVIEQDTRFFETIQLLASITYLAIVQAKRWKELVWERDSNEQKMRVLSTLHYLMENLGQCNDLEELLNLTTSTLMIHAKVTRMFIVLQDHSQFVVKASIGLRPDFHVPESVLSHWFLDTDCSIYDYTSEGAKAWLEGLNYPQDDASNCLVIVPFWRHRNPDIEELNEQILLSNLIGCLCVMGVSEGLSEETQLTIETISHNLHPFIRFHTSLNQ